MDLNLRVLTAKDYREIFGVALSTAKRWIAEDRRKLRVYRLTVYHLQRIYGFDECDIEKKGINKA